MIKRLKEGFEEEETPDLKYYAFDWDDNIVHMPTKIVLKNEDGDEVFMSTSDFAEYRSKIGKEPFKYKGDIIVGFANNSLRNFGTDGDKDFLIDAMRAKPGPAFNDFKESINNGSIFSIITARGHNPNTLKQAVYNYIISGFHGIDKDELIKNLKKYRTFVGEDDMDDDELIKSYLELCKFHPVSFGGNKNANNPEEAKVKAMDEFESYVKRIARILNKRAIIKIGFSDDDIRNVEVMSKHFKNKPDNIVKIYSTAGGAKKEYK